MVTAKSRAGWVVVVRGWGFVTASALLTYAQAVALQRRFIKGGERARLARRAA